MTPGKVAYVMVLATALALAVVWQNALLRSTGYRVHELHTRVAEQHSEQAAHRAHLSRLRNPRRVAHLVSWLGLELEAPSVGPAAGTAVASSEHEPEPAPPVTVAEAPRQSP